MSSRGVGNQEWAGSTTSYLRSGVILDVYKVMVGLVLFLRLLGSYYRCWYVYAWVHVYVCISGCGDRGSSVTGFYRVV